MKPRHDRHLNILPYLGNDLSEQETEEFRAHLDSCAYCQSRMEQERTLSGLLRMSRPFYAAPAALRIKVLGANEKYTAQHRSQWNWGHAFEALQSWKMLAPATLAIVLCLIAVPNIVQRFHAAGYLHTAIANHDRYLSHSLSPEIRTTSPEAVSIWFADKLPFQFRLPRSQTTLRAIPTYILSGASVVNYRGIPAAMVFYEAPSGPISLLVESNKVASVAGGDQVHCGPHIFHYRSEDRFRAITWSAHGLSYAVVSSVAGSARESCMVCHQTMADRGSFRVQP
jgi:anti-sigma factor RsiW